MKKFISYILIALVFVNFFAPISIEINRENRKILAIENIAKAEEECKILSVDFSPVGSNTEKTDIPLPTSITATIKTSDCVGKEMSFSVYEADGMMNPNDVVFSEQAFKVTGNDIELQLFPTEKECESGVCKFKHVVYMPETRTWADNKADFNYSYSCGKNDKGKPECSKNTENTWEGEILSGAEKGERQKPNVDFSIQMIGDVTYTDKTATAKIEIADSTDFTLSAFTSSIYSYEIIIYITDQSGKKIGQKTIKYSKSKPIQEVTFNVEPSTKYTLYSYINITQTTTMTSTQGGSSSIPLVYEKIKEIEPLPFETNKKGDEVSKNAGVISAGVENVASNSKPADTKLPACHILNLGEGTFMGCIAQMFYYILFVPTSYVFALAGNLFDWIFAYSISDDSYRSAFVVQGWGVLRDVCNIFFIFILLYIAFKTILNLKSGKTKELVVNVVIIGLFINFSLFATRVIIDTSNILARVFYNSNTIQTTQNGANGTTNTRADNNTTSQEEDIIPLSAGLVNKVNPQNLIINAEKSVDHSSAVKSNSAGVKEETKGGGLSPGNFIIITLLATAVNVVGIMVFISVAIFFVARVVGLWIMMILSPLAFMSYTIPESQNISQIGWKKWWPETINLAFMAPVFVFFLYIILQFLETGLDITGSEGKTGIAWVVTISVPFIFIMVLLNKAKAIAEKMSGELGQQIAAAASKAVSAAGGVALGAASGGAALAMRGTLGKAAGNLAKSESLKETAAKGGIRGFMASKALKAGELGSKASFDVRNTKGAQKLGTVVGKEYGLDIKAGKGKTGGYVADVDEQVKKNDERAKRVEMSGEAAAEQDKKAKAWNDNYEQDMYAAKLEAEKKGQKFSEQDHKDNYIKNNPKIETSAEINKRRLTERRDAMESGEIKTGLIPNKQVKTMAIKNLENKIGKKAGPSNKESYELESNKIKIQKEQGETATKKLENDKIMNKVVSENGLSNIKDVKEKDVENSVQQRQEKIDMVRLETDEIKNQIKNSKSEPELQKEYADVLAEQQKVIDEFKDKINAGEEPSPELYNRADTNDALLKKIAAEKNKISKLKQDFVNKQNEIRKMQQEVTELSSVIETRKNLQDLQKKQQEQIDEIDYKIANPNP